MNTVVLEVRSLTQMLGDVAHAMKVGRGGREARIAFSTPELLWQVLTAKRWELLLKGLQVLAAWCGWWAVGAGHRPRGVPH